VAQAAPSENPHGTNDFPQDDHVRLRDFDRIVTTRKRKKH
jgi:hypothetical protein